jgi:hypothetical protein
VKIELDLGIEAKNSGSSGASARTPKAAEQASRIGPRGITASVQDPASIAAPSSRMRAGALQGGAAAFGQDSLRVVRVSSVVRSRVSRRVTARETVALVRPSSRAASENEPHSATLEKIAQASKSGSCCIDVLEPRRCATFDDRPPNNLISS